MVLGQTFDIFAQTHVAHSGTMLQVTYDAISNDNLYLA